MSDQDIPDINLGALAASNMASTEVIINTSITSWCSGEEKARVRINGQEYTGRMLGFDGERLLLVDDLNVPTIIYLKSGIAITGPKV
jgi:hypothetical protein